ncbi:MAG: aminotransferase class V-fold PLP-dependent enzyme [Microcella sp.]|uniref:kynureninase n=1 Tax=Microcella sp. TaxID=1913979 RepID=UPI0024CC778F|nr:aminotransferase class V-fold PLP-dependent enzyme [Microcella sp.]UYN83136.1 MAG: aminotransferase class V-fold PLP-dependent enzyme [Microcella sp.]
MSSNPAELRARAAVLDAADPLAVYTAHFVPGDDLVAYLDGNSLGRPVASVPAALDEFVRTQWAGRLIRGWDELWLTRPAELGDRIGAACLGAASGQTIVADSTSVLIFKLLRAAIAARPGRDELVILRDEFPTDRFILERLADDHGLTVRWVDAPLDAGVTPELASDVVSERTIAALFSGVAYRSSWWADMPAVTAAVQAAGALMIWDCSHAVGSVPLELDAWGVDYAVGCSYKYLNGGPGAPAWAYVAERHHATLRNPIPGWLGAAAPFSMTEGFTPAPGVGSLVSGTPPILNMVALEQMLRLIETAGIDAIRAKSIALTDYAIELVDSLIPGATVSTSRDAARRGSHLTIDHPNAAIAVERLWARGVIPDFRHPSGVRIGLSPLSTSFAEVERGIRALADALS